MKIINKVTGETIDLDSGKTETPSTPTSSGKKSYRETFNERSAETQKRIDSRGKIQDTLAEANKNITRNPELMAKTMGILTYVGVPGAAIESAIANPMLTMQSGNINPLTLAKEAMLGATLQKQGQYGDVYKNAGVQKDVADVTGLFLNVAGPAKVAKSVIQTFAAVSKVSDGALLKGGRLLLKATEDATKATGVEVGRAFSIADNTPISPDKAITFWESIDELPKAIKKEATKKFGDIGDFVSDLTVGKMREFKRFLGDFSAFGKKVSGLKESIQDKLVTTAYSTSKKVLEDALTTSYGSKTAKMLMRVENTHHETIKASNYLRQAIENRTLKQPTKLANLADKMYKAGDVSARSAINTIREASNIARKAANESLRVMNAYNRYRRLVEVGSHVGKAAFYGGVAGAAGGQALKKVTGDE